jgi:hypothetical protein
VGERAARKATKEWLGRRDITTTQRHAERAREEMEAAFARNLHTSSPVS